MVPGAGQEGDILHLSVPDPGAEELSAECLPQLLGGEAVGLLPGEGGVVCVDHRLIRLIATLNTEIQICIFGSFFSSKVLPF